MSLRILLIDDSPVDRELTAHALRTLAVPPGPADLVCAEGWREAQPLLAAGGFDLLLLDYSLPDLDGLGILRELASIPHPPVIMTTGQNDLATAVETLRSGAYDYVTKSPDCGPALCLAVDRVLERVRLERDLAESHARLEAYAAELEQKVEARTATLRAQAAEIEALYLKAEESARLKAEIISNVSHELRTPLNIILGYNELLLSELPLDSAASALEILEKIRGQGQRLNEVVHSLLTLADLRAGKLGIALSRFSLAALVEELRADAALLNADKGLVLELQTASTGGEVEHDREKVRAIAYHLLSNAIKFTHAGRVDVTLASDGHAGIVLSVSDTGVGLPPEARAVVFEDFRQLDGSSTRSFEGVGLGLGIVKRYTGLLGGTLRLESRPGAGTTVIVDLPARSPAARVSARKLDPRAKRERRRLAP